MGNSARFRSQIIIASMLWSSLAEKVEESLGDADVEFVIVVDVDSPRLTSFPR